MMNQGGGLALLGRGMARWFGIMTRWPGTIYRSRIKARWYGIMSKWYVTMTSRSGFMQWSDIKPGTMARASDHRHPAAKTRTKGCVSTTTKTTNNSSSSSSSDSQLQLQEQLSGTEDRSDDQSLLISDHLDRNHTTSTSEEDGGVSVSDTATALADVTNNEHASIAAAYRESQGEEYPLVVTADGTTATATVTATHAGPAPRYTTTNNTTTSAVTATVTTPTAQPTATAISTPPPVGILNIVEAVAPPVVSTSTIFSSPTGTAADVATTSTTATTPPTRPRSVHHRMNNELLSTLNRMFSPGPRGTGTGNTTPGPAGPTTNKAAGLFVPTNPTAAAANPHPDKAEEGSSQRQTTSSTAAAGTRSNVVVTEEEGEANTPTSNLGDGGGCKQEDRLSVMTVPTTTATTTAPSILPSSNKLIAAAVAPKSKLLQKFLGRPTNCSNDLSSSLPLPLTMPLCCAAGTAPSLAPAPAHNKPMLSFLDQIKAAKKGPASNPEDIVANFSSSLPAPHNKPMLSFLDQIKAATKKPASSSDNAVVATTITECSSVAVLVAGGGDCDAAGSAGGPLPRRELPPPRPAGGGALPGLGLGVLDAIKARRLS